MKAPKAVWSTIIDVVFNRQPRWLDPSEGDMCDDEFYTSLHQEQRRKTG